MPTLHANCGTLLILFNPGQFTRHILSDMMQAAKELGIPAASLEMGDVWSTQQAGRRLDEEELTSTLRRMNVNVVIGSGPNGLFEWSSSTRSDGQPISFFERMGIKHVMWWTDHPQWANEKMGLRSELQPLLRSINNCHIVKSESASLELSDLLGWPNCHGLPVAEDPNRLRPASGKTPAYDVVAISGAPQRLDSSIERFLHDDNPNVQAIYEIVAKDVSAALDVLWNNVAPNGLRASLVKMGRVWLSARIRNPLISCYRHFRSMQQEHAAAAQWLRTNPRVYFDALELLWLLDRWQRPFIMRYLARYFTVAVFGSDWNVDGIGGGGWVNHDDQTAAYSRGRMAINVAQVNDEEGVAHKPFQIAASGVPMIHNYRRELVHCFSPGMECLTFVSPVEAREAVTRLLDDPKLRESMAHSARERLCRDHTWTKRLPQILRTAGISVSADVFPREILQKSHGPVSEVEEMISREPAVLAK